MWSPRGSGCECVHVCARVSLCGLRVAACTCLLETELCLGLPPSPCCCPDRPPSSRPGVCPRHWHCPRWWPAAGRAGAGKATLRGCRQRPLLWAFNFADKLMGPEPEQQRLPCLPSPTPAQSGGPQPPPRDCALCGTPCGCAGGRPQGRSGLGSWGWCLRELVKPPRPGRPGEQSECVLGTPCPARRPPQGPVPGSETHRWWELPVSKPGGEARGGEDPLRCARPAAESQGQPLGDTRRTPPRDSRDACLTLGTGRLRHPLGTATVPGQSGAPPCASPGDRRPR